MSATPITKARWIAVSGAVAIALVAAPSASAGGRIPASVGATPKANTAPAPTAAQQRRAYRKLGIQRPPIVRGPSRRPTARTAAAVPRHGAPYFAGCPTSLAAQYRNVLFNLTLAGPLEIDNWPGADLRVVNGDGTGAVGGSSNIYWQPLVWWSDGYRWQGPAAGEWMQLGAGRTTGWHTFPLSSLSPVRYMITGRGRYLVGQHLIWEGHGEVSEWNYLVDCPS